MYINKHHKWHFCIVIVCENQNVMSTDDKQVQWILFWIIVPMTTAKCQPIRYQNERNTAPIIRLAWCIFISIFHLHVDMFSISLVNCLITYNGRRGRDRLISWIYNYLYNQFPSPMVLWVRISIRARCTQVCQWLATCRWSSQGTPVSSTNNTVRHDIAELLLKVALNTIKQANNITNM